MTIPTPSSTTLRARPWSARRAYLCVFVPLLLAIAAVSVVRYRYMLHAEVAAAAEQGRAEASRMGAALLPALQRLPPDEPERAQAVLQDSLVYFADTLRTVQWQVQGHSTVTTQKPPGIPVAPGWFEKWVPLVSPRLELTGTRPDGKSVRLHITLQRHVFVDHVWANVRLQSTISIFNAAFALALVAWLVHRHIRLVRRVLRTLQVMQQDHPAMRMTPGGPAAEQAVADALNATAARWHQQLAQQQAQLDRQAQQLELAQWIIAATPMPVTVRRSDGICLDVRQEWLQRFQSPFPEEQHATSPTCHTQPADAECCAFGLPAGPAVAPPHDAVVHMPTTPLPTATATGVPPTRAHGRRVPAGDGVITTDLQGAIETINDTAQFLTGFEMHEAIGQPLDAVFRLADVLQPQPRAGLGAQDMDTNAVGPAHPILVHRSGERHAIEYTATPIRKSNGVAVGCVLTFHEVFEGAQRELQLPWQAPHDALTGLPNQTALNAQLTHALFSAQAQGHHVAVCMIDLDQFEDVNLQHGSGTADDALREVALRLSAFAGPYDLVARMAGDEFVLLMGQLPDAQTIESRTSALLTALGQPYHLGSHALDISASIGVAVYPTLPGDPKALLRQADQAMCQAKQAGGHHVQFFVPQGDPNRNAPATQQARIAQALRTGELRLHYQPQVNQSTGQIIALEALLRWEHPEHGRQGPEHVLPLINDADLAAELGEWVLTEALGQLRRWHVQGLQWTVAVNLTAQHLLRSNFTARLSDILNLFTPLPAHCLQLEVQESAGLNTPQALQAVMVHCQQTLGVRWAIDDFGIGQATLAWVAQVPADTIKVDGSITAAMLHSTRHAAIVSTALAMAQALGRTLVAEGAESPEHCARLRELGCHVVQGYAVAHPMPGSEVAEWARSYRRSVAPMLVLP